MSPELTGVLEPSSSADNDTGDAKVSSLASLVYLVPLRVDVDDVSWMGKWYRSVMIIII